MTVTIVETRAQARAITGGVDTHAEVHVAAALDPVVGYPTRIALRELGRRAQFLDRQLERFDALIVPLVAARAPGLLALYGIGPNTAAMLLIAAGISSERRNSGSSPGRTGCASGRSGRTRRRWTRRTRG
jgi:transposase